MIKNLYYSVNEKFFEHTVVENSMLLDFWANSWFLVDMEHVTTLSSILSIMIISVSFAMLIGLLFFGLKFKKFYNVFFTTFVLINLHFALVNFFSTRFSSSIKATSYKESYNPGALFYNQGIYLKDKVDNDTITPALISEMEKGRAKFYNNSEKEYLENQKNNGLHALLALIAYGLFSIILSIRYNSMVPLAFLTITTIAFRTFYVMSYAKIGRGELIIGLVTLLVLFMLTIFARFIINAFVAVCFSLIATIYIFALLGIMFNKSDYIIGFWSNMCLYNKVFSDKNEISGEYIKWTFICATVFIFSTVFNFYTGGKKAILAK